MFAKLAITAVAAFSVLAAATPLPGGYPSGGNSCSTGPVQCCNSVQSSKNAGVPTLLGLLGVVLQGADVLVGLTCTPITAIGAGGGASCDAQTVCCENNSYGGLVSIGCVPVSL